MSNVSTLEKNNLEAHVDLCAERYNRLEEKIETFDKRLNEVRSDLSDLDTKMGKAHAEILGILSKNNSDKFKTMVGTAGTIIVALLSLLGYIIMNSRPPT